MGIAVHGFGKLSAAELPYVVLWGFILSGCCGFHSGHFTLFPLLQSFTITCCDAG